MTEQETVVPAAFFDELLASFDTPYVPNEPTIRAAQRARALFSADAAG